MLALLQREAVLSNHDAAMREGWDVFDCDLDPEGRHQFQLQRIDTPEDGTPLFPDDRDAWQHVVMRARARSALHRAALDAVDDTERRLIEAACGVW